MRLKSIDIQGFKSFADRVKLDFNDGITAVVGPNGSGKSNIADAVRWVLGEQSTKALRGGKMEDVIFNGTQNRKAQGIASVTLVIENQDKSLMSDDQEVSITRKLYRSGESEYRINGVMARLKDVYELFMDTGIGRDGYAIIGQGKVAEIVSARSKERREIFEEAAGISRFRYRKVEAERQLEQSEENLVRLRDILEELNLRIEPLRIQSEKAKKYLEYANEKKALDISLWVHTIAALKVKSAKMEDELLLSQQRLKQFEDESNGKEQSLLDEQENTRSLTMLIDQLRREISDISEKCSGQEADVMVRKNDIAHHENSIKECEEALEQSGKSQGELDEEFAAKKDELAQKTLELLTARKEQEELSGTLESIGEQIAQLQIEYDSLKLQRSGIFEAIEGAKMDFASSKTMMSESQNRIESLSQAFEQAKEVLISSQKEEDEATSFIAELKIMLSNLQNSANGYLMKRESKEKKLQELTAAVAQKESKIQEKRQRAKLLSDMDKSMEGFAPSIKYVMAQSKGGALGGIIGPVSSLLNVKSQYVVAIETALGPASQNIVVKTQEAAKSAIRRLQSSQSGRATFLPLDTIKGYKSDVSNVSSQEGFVGLACDLVQYDPQYEKIVAWILGKIIVAQDLDFASAIAQKCQYRFRVVTLDGQVINSGGSLTGGFTAKSAGILGRGAEIERLLAEAEEMEKEGAGIVAQKESVAKEVSALNSEIAAIEASRKTCYEDKIRCEAGLASIIHKKEQAIERKNQMENEKKSIDSRVEALKTKEITLEELQTKLGTQLEAIQKKLEETSEQKVKILSAREEMQQVQGQRTSKCTVAQHDIQTIEQQLISIEQSCNTNLHQRQDMLGKIENLRQEIVNSQALIAAANESIGQNKIDKIQREEEIGRGMEQRNVSEMRCTRIREEQKQLASKRDEWYREVVKLTELKNGCDEDVASTVSKLYDEYEMSLSDAQEQANPVEDSALTNRKINELRNKIKNLGSVNVDAIEEYKEVYLRHKTLSEQIADIEKAKSELTKLIGELTRQMCDIFKVKFEQINKNFSKVFIELFEGGSASLSLAEPDNILDSGIEITVAPPGKIIKNLASLSGGEQSFVAIAIFFAILKVNPSPFCLMDEIEAALDDVNVSKFAQYLHKLTDKTQFIAITHRRGTMEEADVLYGVTMQEEGISKLLQLKISEVGKNFTQSN